MRTLLPLAIVAVLLSAAPAHAVKVADITRLGGQRTNVLTGYGLVFGLKGTGDGGDYLPAMKPLAAMLSRFANPTQVVDLKSAKNVAIVSLIATVPANGVRDGDRIDVRVLSIGAASSLKGGYLFVAPMRGPLPPAPGEAQMPLALCEGAVLVEDPSAPTGGVIKGGCVMESDLPAHAIDDGKFTLILEEPSASWETASAIATVINQSEGDGDARLAVAVDAKNIVVTIPPERKASPDAFIAGVLRLPVPQLKLASEARVSINDKTGTIIVTGDVEVSPVVISHKGLTISTIDPKPVATPRTPQVNRRDVVQMDPGNQGGAKLQDLALAFDQLKVPADDRIAIVKELHRTGKLHAKLIINGVER
ncbi:MAG TPA: flagellar basal body P-ring protein FlgI [Humisphaera sp.]